MLLTQYQKAMLSIVNESETKVFQQELLTVKIYPTLQQMGNEAAKEVADRICKLLEEKAEINMIFAAAPSQNEFLNHLIHDKRIDWTRINAFHMDEYIGIHPDAPQSFGHFLRIRIFDKVPFKKVNYLNGRAESLEKECKRYANLLTKYPVDIVCLGIGENGHIAFNDPDVADFNDPKLVKIVKLDPVCRQQQVNEKCFERLDLVPKEALTLTIPALLKAEWMFCIVPFKNKAHAVYRAIYGEISEKCPASILRRKEKSSLYLDAESAEQINLQPIMKNRIAFFFILLMISTSIYAQKIMRIGIIGLDTSHSTAFTELINGGSDETFSKGFRVVAAYPYGSKTIQSSYGRIPGYIEKVKAQGVEIVPSIAELLDKVDCVLLETNDGRLHLEQAIEVFKAGKICYIDKPIGATLGDAIAIYEMAERYNIPIFSSSALRFTPQNQKLRNGELGKILGADCYSPHKVEPTHPDFGFYGIHGVETLYTVMGTGCESVNRMSSDRGDIVVGRWKDGRIGTFRGITKGPQIYGGTAFTPKGAVTVGGYQGYKVLLKQILTFFQTGVAPISKEETIEIFTFMKASNMSKEQNGRIVTMEEAYQKGRKDAQKLIKAYK